MPIGAVRVTVPTFYALGDTKTPVYAASASLLTTFALGLAWVESWEIHGLTAAISVAALVQLVVLSLWLRRRLHKASEALASSMSVDDASIFLHGLKCLLAVAPSAVMVAYARPLFDWMHGPKLFGVLGLGGLALLAGSLYLLMSKIFGIRDVDLIIGIVKRRIRR